MVVRDDHLEAELARASHLVDGRDPAVDGQDEPAALLRESLERVPADAVALVEAARQMPLDVGAELAQHEHGQHGRADAVDVVVAVHANSLSCGDRRADAFDCDGHVRK